MKNLELIHRLKKMDNLIAQKSTGTPKEFAEKIDLSVSRLYDILDDLKNIGVPVKYSRILGSYFYKKRGEFKIEIEWEDKIN
jgi:hypothetical protein